MEKINHKNQKVSWDSILMLKDHILKKCSWFYEFKDIFYKHFGINLLIILESGQSPIRDRAVVDEDKLKGYDFYLN